MKGQKNHYALWMIAGLWLAFVTGNWAAQKVDRELAKQEIKTVDAVFEKAMSDPDLHINEYFELLEDDRYSRHAHANVMGLVLADAYSPERTGVVYVRAMHVMDKVNMQSFLWQTYKRLMEKDREEYEKYDIQFPDSVQKNIESMFSKRPVFLFSVQENMAIKDCLSRMAEEMQVDQAILNEEPGYGSEDGCKVLMKIHNNNHL